MFELLHFLNIGGLSLTPPVSLLFPSNSNLNNFNYQAGPVFVQRSAPNCCPRWVEDLLHANASTFRGRLSDFRWARGSTR